MSIMPKIKRDFSLAMYKRYAEIICTDDSKHNEIPVEGMFRLLEMYRYDAYYDGTYDNWHIPIVVALNRAIEKVFGSLEKSACISSLELTLQKRARNKTLNTDEKEQLQSFLKVFIDALSEQ